MDAPAASGACLGRQTPYTARMDPFLEPGALVRHPDRPDWGLGQVQSCIGRRVTVDFEHAGKQALDGSVVRLILVAEDEWGDGA